MEPPSTHDSLLGHELTPALSHAPSPLQVAGCSGERQPVPQGAQSNPGGTDVSPPGRNFTRLSKLVIPYTALSSEAMSVAYSSMPRDVRQNSVPRRGLMATTVPLSTLATTAWPSVVTTAPLSQASSLSIWYCQISSPDSGSTVWSMPFQVGR